LKKSNDRSAGIAMVTVPLGAAETAVQEHKTKRLDSTRQNADFLKLFMISPFRFL
jgi:hypothetical protein